ncbi:hypothetical protein QQG74_30055 [Micromonospora sp. FIMYZ51]
MPSTVPPASTSSEVPVAMEIYSQASSDATRDALRRLAKSLR